MRRIGIMGGTFNPIHNGHLAIAERAREQFMLDQVLFMPSGVPYMKNQREVLPVQTRCKMTALAIKDTPDFELCEIEASDAAQGKNTYTCDTLKKLKHTDPDTDYFFILGADSLYAIEDWKNPQQIFQNCTILAAVRNTAAMDKTPLAPENGSCQAASLNNNRIVSSQQECLQRQAQKLREKYHAVIEILTFGGMDISSSQIRQMAGRGESLNGFVPKAVETYIRQNGLYDASDSCCFQ